MSARPRPGRPAPRHDAQSRAGPPDVAPAARPLLQALHVMNADGSVSADMRRKLKQVLHLVEMFRPTLRAMAQSAGRISVVDANCGSSYLGFLLYDCAVREMGVPVAVHGIDHDPARVDACRARARTLGFAGMTFFSGAVSVAPLPPDATLLVSLHGCDTATDDALKRAVTAGIPRIEVVPCCQHEIRGLLLPEPPYGGFLQDGILAVDFAAAFTDHLRATWLRARGYHAEVVEFVPLEHTPKNRLIRGTTLKGDGSRERQAENELARLAAALRSAPSLLRD